VTNPLALGVTLGGLLLDVVVPRPKPRAGLPPDVTLLSGPAGSRTRPHDGARGRASAAGGR
jgi:hypothetical protein